ncbi:MAG: ribosome-associated translation inhibitor RaiA [Acidobacteria bacterium]|nr:ribosome-associated translation inhibitor RaiA [Acidobacteriota bacterium]MBE3124051.1 ribosome-associated translation inhibitor RaiA [Acidobacteriota bacterium]MBE3129720.1 ribosome-associated translation inhibitor RaiA [Acidobacteriota bacterium]
MNVHYTARQATLTPEIKAYCEKRLGRLKGLVGDVLDVNVILIVQKNRNKAEINVRAKGGGLVVVEETLDMMDSLNRAFDNLEKKVRKERVKGRDKKRRGGRERKILVPVLEAPESEKRVIRSNYFSLKPMSIEEALIQIDIKSKEVFLFRREGSEEWAVVYRRKDGHYGLVEPE